MRLTATRVDVGRCTAELGEQWTNVLHHTVGALAYRLNQAVRSAELRPHSAIRGYRYSGGRACMCRVGVVHWLWQASTE